MTPGRKAKLNPWKLAALGFFNALYGYFKKKPGNTDRWDSATHSGLLCCTLYSAIATAVVSRKAAISQFTIMNTTRQVLK
jgi:hypothetical protein